MCLRIEREMRSQRPENGRAMDAINAVTHGRFPQIVAREKSASTGLDKIERKRSQDFLYYSDISRPQDPTVCLPLDTLLNVPTQQLRLRVRKDTVVCEKVYTSKFKGPSRYKRAI